MTGRHTRVKESEGETDGSEGHKSGEGCLFCLPARLNAELPLPKETEHKAQYRDMCVHVSVCVVSIPKGPCSSSLYHRIVGALHSPFPH